MAIKRSDVVKSSSKEILKLEEEIDGAIKSQFEYKDFAVYNLLNVSHEVLDKIMEDYKKAGWTVSFNYKEKGTGGQLVFK